MRLPASRLRALTGDIGDQRDAHQQLHSPAVDGRHEALERLAHHPWGALVQGPAARGPACCTMRGGGGGSSCGPAEARPPPLVRPAPCAGFPAGRITAHARPRPAPPPPSPPNAPPLRLLSGQAQLPPLSPRFSKNVAVRGGWEGAAHAPTDVFSTEVPLSQITGKVRVSPDRGQGRNLQLSEPKPTVEMRWAIRYCDRKYLC